MKDRAVSFCNFVIYWSMIAIPVAASFSSAAVDAFIGFMGVSFILKKILTRDAAIPRTPINLPFALLVLVSLLSFFNSVNLHSSLQGILKLMKYSLVIFIPAAEIRDRRHFIRILAALLFGLFSSSFDAIYQLITGFDLYRHHAYDSIIGLARLKAAFPHTNIFAGYLALFTPLSIALLLYHFKGRARMILDIIVITALFCLMHTFCRSAIVGVWLAVIVMALIRKDRIILLLAIVAALAVPFLLPGNIKDWAKTTGSVSEFLLNKERFVLYETSFNMIKHHPWLGVGVNTYSLNYQKYKLHDTSAETANTAWYAHNSYLQMAGETGLTGLLIFIWLLYLFFSRGFAFYRKSGDNLLRVCCLGMLMGTLAFLVNGLTETNLYYPKIATLFWFQAGILLGMIRGSENNALQG